MYSVVSDVLKVQMDKKYEDCISDAECGIKEKEEETKRTDREKCGNRRIQILGRASKLIVSSSLLRCVFVMFSSYLEMAPRSVYQRAHGNTLRVEQ